jgi:hypothetical protein
MNMKSQDFASPAKMNFLMENKMNFRKPLNQTGTYCEVNANTVADLTANHMQRHGLTKVSEVNSPHRKTLAKLLYQTVAQGPSEFHFRDMKAGFETGYCQAAMQMVQWCLSLQEYDTLKSNQSCVGAFMNHAQSRLRQVHRVELN